MDAEATTEFRRYTPDQLSELHKADPTLFDELATAALSQACIGKTEKETIQLRQIQWCIDGQLRKAKTPLQRMQIMENIFYGRIFGEQGQLAQLMYSCKELLDAVTGTGRIPTRPPALYLLKNGAGTEEAGGPI